MRWIDVGEVILEISKGEGDVILKKFMNSIEISEKRRSGTGDSLCCTQSRRYFIRFRDGLGMRRIDMRCVDYLAESIILLALDWL